MSYRRQKCLIIVLTVNINKSVRYFTKYVKRYNHSVYSRYAFSLFCNLSCNYNSFVLNVNIVFFKNIYNTFRCVKNSLYNSLIRTVSYKLFICSVAQNHIYRIYYNRLTCTGFTCKHTYTVMQIYVKFIYHRYISDRKLV